MKPFEFSLEKVLKLREFERKQAETELGKANQEVARIQSELELLARQLIASQQSVSGTKDVYALIAAQKYNNLLDIKKEKLLEELTQANLVVEEKKAVFVECFKKQTSLENLRDTKLNEWKEEKKKEEMTILDDIIISKYNNND